MNRIQYGIGGLGKLFAHHAWNALKKAAEDSPEDIENLGLKLLQREEIRSKLLELAQEALNKKGLALELKTLSFEAF